MSHDNEQQACGIEEIRKSVLSWEGYFMGIAFLSGQRSKDPSTQVGACIINDERRIVGVGYNGMPDLKGRDNDQVFTWNRDENLALDEQKYAYVCHAELNAILNKNSVSLKGCTIYVSLFPCNECAKLIIQSGIKEVVYYSDKYENTPSTRASKKMLSEADVKVRQCNPLPKLEIDFESINAPANSN